MSFLKLLVKLLFCNLLEFPDPYKTLKCLEENKISYQDHTLLQQGVSQNLKWFDSIVKPESV